MPYVLFLSAHTSGGGGLVGVPRLREEVSLQRQATLTEKKRKADANREVLLPVCVITLSCLIPLV